MLYCDQYEPIRNLTFVQKGILFDSIFKFQCGEDVTFEDATVEIAYNFFLQTFKRDHDKYLKRCKKNKENIKKRWNKKDTKTYDRIPSDTKNTDSDSDSDIYIVEILDHLNQKTNSSYRPSSKKTQRLIRARKKEGYTLDDFKTVIDKKTAEWFHNPKMQQYLRPETLFGTKFESYLNANSVTQPKIVECGMSL